MRVGNPGGGSLRLKGTDADMEPGRDARVSADEVGLLGAK